MGSRWPGGSAAGKLVISAVHASTCSRDMCSVRGQRERHVRIRLKKRLRGIVPKFVDTTGLWDHVTIVVRGRGGDNAIFTGGVLIAVKSGTQLKGQATGSNTRHNRFMSGLVLFPRFSKLQARQPNCVHACTCARRFPGPIQHPSRRVVTQSRRKAIQPSLKKGTLT